ncbi:hypothetical protein HDU86_008163 [Geranomyces michiganensis]|nr:hypothetical protein HDU86_008163 [Geranomyces michiganensis]
MTRRLECISCIRIIRWQAVTVRIDKDGRLRNVLTPSQQGLTELDELGQFIKQRIAAEEAYASKLSDAVKSKPRSDGFGRDEGLVAQIFNNAKEELSKLTFAHKQTALNLTSNLTALTGFGDKIRKRASTQKDRIDSLSKTLSGQRTELQNAVEEYHRKSREADAEEAKSGIHDGDISTGDVEVMDVMINVGAWIFTVEDFNTLLSRLQRDVPTQDIRSIWGTTKDCVLGKDVAEMIRNYLRTDDETAQSVFAYLTAENFLRPTSRVSVTSLTSSATGATANPNQTYVWKRLAIETEPAHRRVRREAERAEHNYRKCVAAAEESRSNLELAVWEYLRDSQEDERDRINLIKRTLAGMNAAEEIGEAARRATKANQAVYLETLDADREVEIVAERLRTGTVRVPPIIYRSCYGTTPEAIIGVSLEEQSPTDMPSTSAPAFLTKCLTVLSRARSPPGELSNTAGLPAASELLLWTTPQPPPTQSVTIHKPIPTATVVPLTRHYLSHLPQSVIHPEIYDPLKLLYLSKTDDDEHSTRVLSLASLIGTMPVVHWAAARDIVRCWAGLIARFEEKEREGVIAELASALGHVLLRPGTTTAVTLHDKHPVRLFKDLVTHHEAIFAQAPRVSETIRRPPPSVFNSSDSVSPPEPHPTPAVLATRVADDSDDDLDIEVAPDGTVSSRAGSASSLHVPYSGGSDRGGSSANLSSAGLGGSLAELKILSDHEDDEDAFPIERA